ncbi:MAG: hypothetical protein JSW25_07690 [Thermoplasmata archaeon]|nr:MAG: hypothetical protein JSW25_07690 [Thermoplasmata archaeon]
MNDEEPPVGLSDEVAFTPPGWAKPLLAISVLAMGGVLIFCLALGVMLLAGDVNAVKAWDFWGDTDVLGALLVMSSALLALGFAFLLKRSDDSLALFLLGIVVFEGTMLWGIVAFEGKGGPVVLLLLMVIPFLALFGLQTDEIRRWFFLPSDEEGVA